MRKIIVSIIAAIALLTFGAAPSEARTVKPEKIIVTQACVLEDGSSQRACYWNARTMGNGSGQSFISLDYGRRTIYVPNSRMPKRIDKSHALVVKVGQYSKIARNYAEVWYGRTLLVDDAKVIRY